MKFKLPPSSVIIDDKPVDLEYIRSFRGEFEDLMKHVARLFCLSGSYCEYRKDERWYVSTGGYSNLEKVVRSMRHCPLFWIACWESSGRDGTYVFTTNDVREIGNMPVVKPACTGNSDIAPIDRDRLMAVIDALTDTQLELFLNGSCYELPCPFDTEQSELAEYSV